MNHIDSHDISDLHAVIPEGGWIRMTLAGSDTDCSDGWVELTGQAQALIDSYVSTDGVSRTRARLQSSDGQVPFATLQCSPEVTFCSSGEPVDTSVGLEVISEAVLDALLQYCHTNVD